MPLSSPKVLLSHSSPATKKLGRRSSVALSAMHLMLVLDEILRMIFDELDRMSLASLVLVCRAFQGPATEALWRSINSLEPLLSLFPAGLVTTDIRLMISNRQRKPIASHPIQMLQLTSRKATLADIAPLLEHARFINEVNYRSNESHVIFVSNILTCECDRVELFPTLRRLNIVFDKQSLTAPDFLLERAMDVALVISNADARWVSGVLLGCIRAGNRIRKFTPDAPDIILDKCIIFLRTLITIQRVSTVRVDAPTMAEKTWLELSLSHTLEELHITGMTSDFSTDRTELLGGEFLALHSLYIYKSPVSAIVAAFNAALPLHFRHLFIHNPVGSLLQVIDELRQLSGILLWCSAGLCVVKVEGVVEHEDPLHVGPRSHPPKAAQQKDT